MSFRTPIVGSRGEPTPSGDTCCDADADTTLVTDAGSAVYWSADDTVDVTDALALASSRFAGFWIGTVGQIRVSGVVDGVLFTTDGGAPSAGDPVFLAPSTDDGGTGAGKLTATPPSDAGQTAAEVGLCVSSADYAGLKKCKVQIQVKGPVLVTST